MIWDNEDEWLIENQEYQGQYEENKRAELLNKKYFSKNALERLNEGDLKNTFYKLTYKKNWCITDVNNKIVVYQNGIMTNLKVKKHLLLETCWEQCDSKCKQIPCFN